MVLSFSLFLFFISCFSSARVFATELFYDDFSSGDTNNWEMFGDDYWDVDLVNGLSSNISYRKQGYLITKNTYSLTDYEFHVRVKNVSGIDQHFVFRANEDLSAFYQVELRFPDIAWPQDPAASVRLWKYKHGSYSRLLPDIPYPFVKNKDYKLKIRLESSSIKIFIDDSLVVDVLDDTDPILSGAAGVHAYAGDYRPGNVVNYYNDVRLSQLSGRVRNKTIFLPGFGGSWNTEALVYNRPVADDSWVMTPFVKNYDRLIQSLIEGGYELGEDLFVWNYDWRKPVADNIFILNNFINSKTEETEKINLVGHSMGGLIARLWAQDGDNKSKINKVISLGSPHSGLVKAYEWFNGGKIPGDNDPGSIALVILYQLSRRTFSSDIEVLRSYVPSLRDVLPTFDFVAKGSRFISSDSLVERNVYLKNKNLEVDSIFDNLLAISGVGQKTVSGLLVGERSVFDKVLGKWPDGSPLKYIYGDGDGTVIKTSSFFDGDEFIEKSSNHGEIVDFSINEVLGELGIGITVDSGVSYDLGNKSIFFIGSPAYLKVNCDGIPETLSDSLGFVIVDSLGECQVEVVGTGSGTYHLVSGTTTNAESWRYFEKEISNGEIDTLSFKNGLLKTDQTNLAYLYKLIEYDAGKLLEKYPGQKDLLAVVNNAKSKNIDRLIVSLFDFRKSKKESTMSSSIIRTAESIMRIENQLLPIAKIKQAYTKAVQSKSLVDRITRLYLVKKIEPTKFGAESYLLLEQMLNQSGSDYAKSVLASKLASEVW